MLVSFRLTSLEFIYFVKTLLLFCRIFTFNYKTLSFLIFKYLYRKHRKQKNIVFSVSCINIRKRKHAHVAQVTQTFLKRKNDVSVYTSTLGGDE
jgi:hypothetical protein